MVMIGFEAGQAHGAERTVNGNAAKQFAIDITDIPFATSGSPGKGQQGATVAR